MHLEIKVWKLLVIWFFDTQNEFYLIVAEKKLLKAFALYF